MMGIEEEKQGRYLTVEDIEALGTNPWERLANAIIWQAAEDYRNLESRTELEKLDRFFRSAGFSALCGLDGEKLRILRRRTLCKHTNFQGKISPDNCQINSRFL